MGITSVQFSSYPATSHVKHMRSTLPAQFGASSSPHKRASKRKVLGISIGAALNAVLGTFFGISWYANAMADKYYPDTIRNHDVMMQHVQNRLPIEKDYDPWPSNHKIYAAVVQDGQTLDDDNGYLMELMQALKHTASIQDAHNTMANGIDNWKYKLFNLAGFSQVPVDSTNLDTGWKKSESKPRFVLIVRGEGTWFNPALQKNEDLQGPLRNMANYARQTLADEYHLPPENLKMLETPDKNTLEKGYQWLQEMQAKNPDAEGMVIFIAHGWASDPPNYPYLPSNRDKEGGKIGNLKLTTTENISESEDKQLSRKYLSGYKNMTVIVHSCYSGSWIAYEKPRTLPVFV